MSGQLHVVVGGQYGSEGKGAIAAYLTRPEVARSPVHCVRVAGPNAGHTVIGRGPTGEAHPWRLRSVPVAAVSNPDSRLYLAAGSEVDYDVLDQEVAELTDWGYRVDERLTIDSQATRLDAKHRSDEAGSDLTARLGSTSKGIGAARQARLNRTAELVGGAVDVSAKLRQALDREETVLIEGTQGYGLGLHAGFYPFCTSSDCRAIDFLAMAGLSPWTVGVALTVWVVARTYPIRVAGNSGPLADELGWDQVGQPAELTTVTQKVRRVGAWDASLINQAVIANGGPYNPRVRVALTMFDYVSPDVAGATEASILTDDDRRLIGDYEDDAESLIALLGTGPNSVIDLR